MPRRAVDLADALRTGRRPLASVDRDRPGRLLERRWAEVPALGLAREACAGRLYPVARRRQAKVRGRQA
eukprot:2537160-Alexandrium_andersonii.AAC.1